jgi:hypothetical protein
MEGCLSENSDFPSWILFGRAGKSCHGLPGN